MSSDLEALVAISVSDPPDRDLEQRGLAPEHVRHAFVEMARQVLAAGGSLAYGGDLRAGGYTETLTALLRTYSRADRPAVGRVRQYLAWPVWKPMSASDGAALAVVATSVRVAPPVPAPPDGAPSRAAAFTAMRKLMSQESQVRIVLGGRVDGQSGRWPGVVEEAYLAVRDGKPLFVLGGAGGAAARVAEAVQGEWPAELTSEYQREHTPVHAELDGAGVGIEEDELRRTLQGANLANGLGEEDNRELMTTRDLDLMIALTMRGLWTIQG
jgi:hypothetical protein